MRLAFIAALIGVSLSATSATHTAQPPATLAIDGTFLAHLKAHPNPAVLDAIRSEADSAMTVGPFSVMDKKETPPSGDKHDYMSLAPYWWPDPAKPNGLPYIRRDGETNPERYKCTDDTEFNKVQSAVHALGLGYYFTGKEEYAARATLLLRTWFLDPATRMNPNLNFAQAVLGVNTGRGTGLIDVHGLPRLIDGLALLDGSHALTAKDKDGLHKWFTEYLVWLRTSANGKDETEAKNNHGSWMDQQVVAVALYLGDKKAALDLFENAKKDRIAFQIKPDGSQPLELARTKSFSYSVFNLDALSRLAEEARTVNVDLWSFRSQDGASIRAALDFLLPYGTGEKQWTHQALNGVEGDSLTEPLLLASMAYKNPGYLAAAKKLEKSPGAELLLLQAEAESKLAAH